MNKIRSLLLVCLIVGLLGMQVNGATLGEIEQLIETKQLEQIKLSITRLENYLNEEGENASALWLLAKAHLYLGDRSGAADKLALFEAGKEYAERAVELEPSSPHTHYWHAALMGRVGQTRGIMQSLFMVRPMKEALDRVLELDQDYADAYYVLSQLYQEAPGFPLSIGNKGLALENAYLAVGLDADNLDFQIQLAKALQHNKKTAEAVQVLEELLARPAINTDQELKKEAEALLVQWR